jgi:hypothetical protein
MLDYFHDAAGLGLEPRLVLNLFDSEVAASRQMVQVFDQVSNWLGEIPARKSPVTDLIIYYIGHGILDESNHLVMLVKSSRSPLESDTGIRAAALARMLNRVAGKLRRVVILDCCFSEAALRAFVSMADLNQQISTIVKKDFGAVSPDDDLDSPTAGTLLFCSCAADELSIGPPKAERTLFTGAVLDVLRKGAEVYPEYLSFADLCKEAFRRMSDNYPDPPMPVLHQPHAKRGSLINVPAFRNLGGSNNVVSLANAQHDLEPRRSVQSRLEDLLKKSERDHDLAIDLVLEKALSLPPDSLEPRRSSFGTGDVDVARQKIMQFLDNTIDLSVLKESWNRYVRGEVNCFDQSLYTEEGRRTFEAITERYRTLENFRTSVDNYLVEFEKRLFPYNEASKRVDLLLSFEGSKLYTLLAHVAGRLR